MTDRDFLFIMDNLDRAFEGTHHSFSIVYVLEA